MKTYRFIYNNNDSKYLFECDADAMIEAREELKRIHKKDQTTNTVHVWEQKDNGKFRYIVSYNI